MNKMYELAPCPGALKFRSEEPSPSPNQQPTSPARLPSRCRPATDPSARFLKLSGMNIPGAALVLPSACFSASRWSRISIIFLCNEWRHAMRARKFC